MMRHVPATLLNRALFGDAVASGATGLLLTFAAGALDALLGLPVPLLRGAGLILIPYAVVVWLPARRVEPPRGAVWCVIACNAIWAIDSVLLLVAGPVAPTALGIAFVVAQASVVALFAELQVFGLRRQAHAAA